MKLKIISVCLAVLFVFSASAGEPRAPDPQIETAIKELGDGDFEKREKAAQFLWSRGKAAVPALKNAAKSDDAEVASKAKEILAKFNAGQAPDVSPEVQAFVKKYTEADEDEKMRLLQDLNSKKGPNSNETLLALAAAEQNPNMRTMLIYQMWNGLHMQGIASIYATDPDTAEKFVNLCGRSGLPDTYAIRAQYLALTGRLDERLNEVQNDPSTEARTELIYLYRAKGRPAQAREAVAKANNLRLVPALLLEQGQWEKLSDSLEKLVAEQKAQGLDEGEEFLELVEDGTLNMRIWAAWRAGKTALVDSLRKSILKPPPANEVLLDFMDEGRPSVALALTDESPKALERAIADYPRSAAEILIAQYEYQKANEFIEKRFTGNDNEEHANQPSRSAGDALRDEMLYQLGDFEGLIKNFEKSGKPALVKAAEDARQAVANGADFDNPRNFAEFPNQPRIAYSPRLHETFVRAGRDKEAFDLFMLTAECYEAMPRGSRHPFAVSMFRYLNLPPEDSTPVAYWWKLLSRRKPAPKVPERIAKLKQILELKTPSPELEQYLQIAIDFALENNDGSHKYFQNWARSAILRSAKRTGDAEFEKRWAEKAAAMPDLKDAESRAHSMSMEHDVARPRSTVMAATEDAWAPHLKRWRELTKSGDAAGAQAAFKLACVAGLGNESATQEIVTALTEAGKLDDAESFLRTIIQCAPLTEPGSFSSVDLRLTLANILAQKQKFADAALQRELALAVRFENDSPRLRDVFEARYAIHTLQAQEALAAKRFDDAKREIAAARGIFSLHIDLPSAVVPMLEQAGKKDEADALFQAVLNGQREKVKAYPNSELHYLLVAKLCAACKRELDVALEHAKRAVELSPKDVEAQSVLAGVRNARGEK